MMPCYKKIYGAIVKQVHGEEPPPHIPSSSSEEKDGRIHDDVDADISIEIVKMKAEKSIDVEDAVLDN